MIAILSFPRSGNHFTRYIIEFLTGRPTIGCMKNMSTDPTKDSPICCRIGPKLLKHVKLSDPIASKYHFVSGSPIPASFIPIESTEKLILILRHPIETWLSHRYDKSGEIFSPSTFSEGIEEIATKDSDRFLDNLKFYDKYKKQKICIFYEDLISSSPQGTIKKIAEFLDIEGDIVEHFINNIEKFRFDSLKSTHRKPISAFSNNSSNFYSDRLMQVDEGKYRDLKRIFEKTLEHHLIEDRYGQ